MFLWGCGEIVELGYSRALLYYFLQKLLIIINATKIDVIPPIVAISQEKGTFEENKRRQLADQKYASQNYLDGSEDDLSVHKIGFSSSVTISLCLSLSSGLYDVIFCSNLPFYYYAGPITESVGGFDMNYSSGSWKMVDDGFDRGVYLLHCGFPPKSFFSRGFMSLSH